MRQATIALICMALMPLASALPAHADLVLNEALANEPGSTTTFEWVEILNWPDTGQATLLLGYKYVDGGQTVTLDTSISIPAGGFAILARKATGASSFEERWGNSSGVWGDHPSEYYPLVAISQMSLRNSSDTIRLVSSSGDTSTILWLFDPGDGISLERIRPGSDDSQANFAICDSPLGSTPGMENSVLPSRGDLAIDTVVIGPASPIANGPVQFAIRIVNVGFGDAEPGSVGLYQANNLATAIDSKVFGSVTEAGETSVVLGWDHPRPGVTDLLIRLSTDSDTSNNAYSMKLITRFDKPYLIVSEFLANPEPGGPEEWIEIANVSNFPIRLEGLRAGDSLNSEPIPDSSGDLAPYSMLVLTESEAAFRAHYPTFTGTTVQIPGWRELNNTGDGIRLYGPSGEIIDSLSFRTLYPDNHSVERVELSASFAPPGDWAESKDDAGATPGQSNSVVRGNPGALILDSIWLVPSEPSWGDTIQIYAAISNNSFGPASGWKVVASRDLDFSSPGASLAQIGEANVPTVEEDESVVVEVVWEAATPGIHRVHLELRDESGEANNNSALVATVRFSHPMIIISEYIAAPTSGGPGEWIELYNASDISISIRGMRVGDSTTLAAIPPPLPELEPGAFLVLAQDEDRFREFYSTFTGQLRALVNWPSLNDQGDLIRIVGPADEIIDSVSYGILSEENISIERRQLVPAIADPRDWGKSTDDWGATPGTVNSIRRYSNDVSVDSVVLEAYVVDWPGPIVGSVYVSNPGFSDVQNLVVSVLLPGHGEVARLVSSSHLESGQRTELPFTFDAPGIGRNWFDFLITEDDVLANNYEEVIVYIVSTFPAVIISEYLADPDPSGPGEWVELFNASNIEISLTGFDLGDSTSFASIPFSLVDRLYPDSFLVLCANVDQFRMWYPSFNGKLVPLPAWRELNNSGDKIRLRGSADEIIDSLTFIDVDGDNNSSERLTLTPTLSTPSDWTVSVDPSGATPGRPNSVNAATAGSFQVDVTPNPVFRAAGQNARIDYRLEIGESLTLKIYDRAGRLVKTIADEVPSATGSVEWNGTDDDGYELRPGPYVLLARSEPAGAMKKMVVVIAP